MKGAADGFLKKLAEMKFAEAGIGSDILQPERFRTVQIDVIADICKFFSVLKLLLRFIAVRLQIIDILSSQSYEKLVNRLWIEASQNKSFLLYSLFNQRQIVS